MAATKLHYEFAGVLYEMVVDESASLVIVDVPEYLISLDPHDRAYFSETFVNEIRLHFNFNPKRVMLIEICKDREELNQLVEFTWRDEELFQKARINVVLENMSTLY